MKQQELPWIAEARKHIGTKEIKGKRHNPTIIGWLKKLGAWWNNDEVPWCGTFVGNIMETTDRYVVKNWFRAKAWADTDNMLKLHKPAYGCIVVFTRKGGGHVGFVVGKKGNNLCVLGGNQNDAVNIKTFSRRRVLGYYWPSRKNQRKAIKSKPFVNRYELPDLEASASKSES